WRLPPERVRRADIAAPRAGCEEAQRKRRRGLLARKVLADAADGFRRDTEVGGHHPLRHALRERWVAVEKFEIPFLGCCRQGGDNALVLRGVVTLESGAGRGGVARHLVDQKLMRGR